MTYWAAAHAATRAGGGRVGASRRAVYLLLVQVVACGTGLWGVKEVDTYAVRLLVAPQGGRTQHPGTDVETE